MDRQTIIVLCIIAFVYVVIGIVYAYKCRKDFHNSNMDFSLGDILHKGKVQDIVIIQCPHIQKKN